MVSLLQRSLSGSASPAKFPGSPGAPPPDAPWDGRAEFVSPAASHLLRKFSRLFAPRVKRRDLIDFGIQMSAQLSAGMQLTAALETCAHESGNPSFGVVLAEILRSVESGSPLHEAMQRHPRIFSLQVISVIRAGELGGKLPAAFEEITSAMEWLERLIEDVRQASIYPLFIFGAIASFVLLLFTFVIPKFIGLLSQLKVKQPLVTQFVFGASDFIKNTWWLWTALFLVILPGIALARRLSKSFAYYFDAAKLSLPIFGDLHRMIALSRFTHTFASLYRSGIPLLEVLELCQGVSGNAVVASSLRRVRQDCEQGEMIHQALRRHQVFTSLLVRMVAVGETTGKLDVVLENVASYYNEVIPRRIKKLFGLMEPLAILFLVLLLATIGLAVFLPIMTLVEQLQKR